MRKAKRISKPTAQEITISFRNGLWGQGRTIKLSKLTAGIFAMIIVGIFAASGYFTYHYLYLSYDRAHLTQMKNRNIEQARKLEIMQAQLEQLKSQQQKVTEEHNKLKKAMGYDPERPLSKATPSRGGQGGGASDLEVDLPSEFSALAGEITEELSIADWESRALAKLLESDPARFLSFPSAYPVETADLSSDFGLRKNPFRGRKGEVHHGVDFSGDVGNEVFAAGQGKVVFAGWDATYGRLIKIDHGNGLISWYGHNYRLLVKKGQEVERGDKIALMGSSGRSTGPHVHFAVEKNGEFISPWQFLP